MLETVPVDKLLLVLGEAVGEGENLDYSTENSYFDYQYWFGNSVGKWGRGVVALRTSFGYCVLPSPI